MNGVLSNQSNHSMLGASWRTTKLRPLLAAPRLFAHSFFSKKTLFISAGALAFTAPLAAYSLSPSNDSTNTPPAASQSSQNNSDSKNDGIKVQLDHRSTSSNSSGASSNTSLTIDGESVPVPENGSVHKTITTGQQTTEVDIHTNSQQSANSSSSSSSVHVDSAQSTSQEGG